jgi:hypothetical protein
MVNRNFLPYRTARTIYEDIAGAHGVYGFLPERDLGVLARWVEDPYHLC